MQHDQLLIVSWRVLMELFLRTARLLQVKRILCLALIVMKKSYKCDQAVQYCIYRESLSLVISRELIGQRREIVKTYWAKIE